MGSFSTEAVVLRRKDVGEADRLVVAFTRAVGKKALIAKGVRRPTSKMAGHIEPGRRSKLHIVERRSWPLVTQAETIESYLSVSADLQEVRDTLSLLEIVDSIIDEDQRDSRVYDLLVQALEASAKALATQRGFIATAFALQALALVGYQAELHSCITCNRPFENDQFVLFSAARGGLVHTDCGIPGPGTYKITAQAAQALVRSAQADLFSLLQIPTDAAVISEIERPIRAFVEWTSEKQLKTAKLLALPL